MTKDLTEKNLVEAPEVFADISNVNLYDGEQVIQPEDLELLPQEMHYKGSEGKPAKVMADVRMRWRKNGTIIALIQMENQSEINNIMPVRDLGYIFNNYNEQIKEHKRENAIADIFTVENWQMVTVCSRLLHLLSTMARKNGHGRSASWICWIWRKKGKRSCSHFS